MKWTKERDKSQTHHALMLEPGEPLQALGQGELCEHCEARGLCRRDHWGKAR